MKVKFNRITPWSLAALFTVCMTLPLLAQAVEMTVGKAIHHDTSAPMSNVVPLNTAGPGGKKEIPLLERVETGRFPDLAEPDGGLQSQSSPARQLAPTPSFIVSAPGLSEQDNRDVLGFSIVPPDINGDIGLDDAGNRIYIQYINLVWGVFDVTGNLIHGPFAGNSFWTGFGGACETNNDGDPVVLYDDEAGQWLFSQFSINQGIQCMAISTTSNPLGPYHRYAFEVSPGKNNDYPKLGVWSDGAGQSAYTFTTRDFPVGSTFGGSGVMERDAMLIGAPAQFIKFSNPCVGGDCIEGQLPPHLAGPNPPAGTCPTFWTAVDSAFDDSPFANDGYRNHTLCVDWSNLANSTYTEGPLVAAGSNFDRFLAGNVINPVNGGENLDALQFFSMYRAQYRWFGTYGSVVLNTTVDAGGDRAGIRWTENRSTDGDSGWFLQQDGTYAPADGLERWMGSVAQDQDGNIALGYSVTGASLFPSVRYTSRMAADAAGQMPGGEVSCHEGTGAQTASSNRWGDYSSMSVDPTDDCTFWYTQEYYETTGSFDFNTRICSFKFADCGGVCEPNEPGTELSCDDGVDNDCDGDTDCNDADCNADPACEPPICNNDGVCDSVAGETCENCVNDCVTSTPGASCGNGVCEAGAGDNENGVNCPADCNGKLNGKPANRFSCGFNDGYAPDACDPRCTTNGFDCTEVPVVPGSFCCGDEVCEGPEDGFTCEFDCGPPPPNPFCGNNITELGEICDGTDVNGDTCSDLSFDGGTLMCQSDCLAYDTSACTGGECSLGQLGDSCDANAECCSDKCKGKPGSKVCK